MLPIKGIMKEYLILPLYEIDWVHCLKSPFFSVSVLYQHIYIYRVHLFLNNVDPGLIYKILKLWKHNASAA